MLEIDHGEARDIHEVRVEQNRIEWCGVECDGMGWNGMERFDSCWEFSDFSPKPPVSLTEKEKHLSNVFTRLKTQYHISIIPHKHALTFQSHEYCRVFVHNLVQLPHSLEKEY